MIKINLLRNMGVAQSGGIGLSAFGSVTASKEARQDAIKKVAVIFAIPVTLLLYEKFNLSEIQAEYRQAQERLRATEAERSQFGDQGPRVEKYTKEKQRIDQEIEIVKNLARARLREVKALDALQSLVPPKSWIKKVSIRGDTVTLDGYSNTDSGVYDFIRALENSVFFSKVEPKSTSQEVLPSGTVKKFELEFRVGKREQVQN